MSKVSEYFGTHEYHYRTSKVLVDPSIYIGIEIELENVPRLTRLKYWSQVNDGSLRVDGTEFKFIKPLNGYDIIAALSELYTYLKANKVKPTFSSRTGTHIHLNLTNLDIQQASNFIYSFMHYEDLFFKIGRIKFNRKHNSYCTPLKNRDDYNQLLFYYEQGDYNNFLHNFSYNVKKYSSAYVNRDYGTFEVRLFDSTIEPFRILNWVNLLLAFFKFTKDNPINANGIDKLPVIFGSMFKSIERYMSDIKISNTSYQKPILSFREAVPDYYNLMAKVLGVKKVDNKVKDKVEKKEPVYEIPISNLTAQEIRTLGESLTFSSESISTWQD